MIDIDICLCLLSYQTSSLATRTRTRILSTTGCRLPTSTHREFQAFQPYTPVLGTFIGYKINLFESDDQDRAGLQVNSQIIQLCARNTTPHCRAGRYLVCSISAKVHTFILIPLPAVISNDLVVQYSVLCNLFAKATNTPPGTENLGRSRTRD